MDKQFGTQLSKFFPLTKELRIILHNITTHNVYSCWMIAAAVTLLHDEKREETASSAAQYGMWTVHHPVKWTYWLTCKRTWLTLIEGVMWFVRIRSPLIRKSSNFRMGWDDDRVSYAYCWMYVSRVLKSGWKRDLEWRNASRHRLADWLQRRLVDTVCFVISGTSGGCSRRSRYKAAHLKPFRWWRNIEWCSAQYCWQPIAVDGRCRSLSGIAVRMLKVTNDRWWAPSWRLIYRRPSRILWHCGNLFDVWSVTLCDPLHGRCVRFTLAYTCFQSLASDTGQFSLSIPLWARR